MKIDIALQGGGAHGAFTWGVLDRLLEDNEIEIVGISGTSAGAMNAIALAQGLAQGSRRQARDILNNYWRQVSVAAQLSPIQRSLFDRLTGRWSLDRSPAFFWSQVMTRVMSPYQFNLLDLNPLRDIVRKSFDFDVINRAALPRLFLSATNVRTGRAKIFRQPQISANAAMASACLPFLFRAVEIDGEAYWDGGYMGNPPLFPLIDESQARDIVIVQINPFRRDDLPRSAYEIENRLNEITFNASLIKELRSVAFLHEIIKHENLDREAYRDARLHLIGAEEHMRELSVSSKLNAESAFLEHLRQIGRDAATQWLKAHRNDLGVQSTWRPKFVFEESLKPAHMQEGFERNKARD
ncbi:MAG: patatin-like phospholipase family protein [Hyphomicrobiaceae bacterium]